MAERGRGTKRRGEDAAEAYLSRIGIDVVDRSWRCDAGVIDLVGREGNVVVFVDVRTHTRVGTSPASGITPSAARRLRRLARAYASAENIGTNPWRFDRIDLFVITEDRALLRHHRAVLPALT